MDAATLSGKTAMVRRAATGLHALLLAAALLVAGPGNAGPAQTSEPWPELPQPPDSKVQWVGQSMRVNGVPTRIQQFQSRASRAQVAEFFRAHWTGAYPHPASVHSMGDDITVVGQKHGPYLLTAKIEDAPHGASRGLISVALVVGSSVDREARDLPLMPGARIASVVESDDPGKHSREWTVFNPQPTASVTRFYETALGNAGWRRIQDNQSAASARTPAGSLMVYSREGHELTLTITDQPKGRGAVLVANLVTKDTGSGSN